MDFHPAHTQLSWFQGQQELSVVATDVVPNGDWTHQLLMLLETHPPAWGHLQLPAPEPLVAAAAPRGLGPSRDPPLRPHDDFGGVVCVPSPAVTLPLPACSQCSQ
ncbi:rano class II histocompatibility antigen, D-1 beta chain-like [Vidua macroura]|uniref:rano class II histocompatibility antigen, D-1 beta chain-like n=1 Tax=Vidua macroura TaxID=187451 RepID=UPI0023A890ED|nr:rano class II histocompatibility antigen, D-1 beta chain-like [Vidua macroura]